MVKGMNSINDLEAILRKRISERKIKYILETVGEKVKEDIQSLAPVDTGEYKNSIKLSEVTKDGSVYRIKIYSNLDSGWKNVPLGYLLEWGTGIRGEETNNYPHGLPYRQTPWVYFNERYARWIYTYGNIARPHFYPGLHLNKSYYRETILKEISK